MKTRHLICGLLLLPMIFSCSHQQQIRDYIDAGSA